LWLACGVTFLLAGACETNISRSQARDIVRSYDVLLLCAPELGTNGAVYRMRRILKGRAAARFLVSHDGLVLSERANKSAAASLKSGATTILCFRSAPYAPPRYAGSIFFREGKCMYMHGLVLLDDLIEAATGRPSGGSGAAGDAEGREE
jgi:hypothetical protein